MSFARVFGVGLAAALLTVGIHATTTQASPPAISNLAKATAKPVRFARPVVQYDVFGDSIVFGYGVAPHRSWIAHVLDHLRVTEPNIDYRVENRAVSGQSIVTPSVLAVDQSRSTLLQSLERFFAEVRDGIPASERRIVITPSVNELIVSDQGPAARERVDKAVDGTVRAFEFLLAQGVRREHITILPMPPIGIRYATRYDIEQDVDTPLARQIPAVNKALASILSVRNYAELDPEDDGLADVAFFDGLEQRFGGPVDGLHLDADGHEYLARAIIPLFGTS